MILSLRSFRFPALPAASHLNSARTPLFRRANSEPRPTELDLVLLRATKGGGSLDRPRAHDAGSRLSFGAPSYRGGAPNDLIVLAARSRTTISLALRLVGEAVVGARVSVGVAAIAIIAAEAANEPSVAEAATEPSVGEAATEPSVTDAAVEASIAEAAVEASLQPPPPMETSFFPPPPPP